jgi:hypothetical protein
VLVLFGNSALSFSTAASTRDWLDEETVTRAPEAKEASATANPIPEVPPMMRTCLFWSFWYLEAMLSNNVM